MDDNFIRTALSASQMHTLVSEMRGFGYNVEHVHDGYVCHERVKHGLELVMYAKRLGKLFHVKMHVAFFDTGKLISEKVH